jgi:hypothetical protein
MDSKKAWKKFGKSLERLGKSLENPWGPDLGAALTKPYRDIS